tara:strand:+ start:2443 stop:3207 length:765 start_codon:yes stop_codon:yes gene_type:complete
MSGLATLCNAGPLIAVDGRSFQLKGRTLRHLGEAEAQILYMRGDLRFAVSEAISGLSKEQQVDIWEKLLMKIRFRWIGCNSEDIQRFYSSLEGRIYSFWQSVRHNGLSADESQELYFKGLESDSTWESRIKYAIETATGESDYSRLYKIMGLTRVKSDYTDEYLLPGKASLFASLFSEPFGYTPDQIADMTLGQISLVATKHGTAYEDLKSELSLVKQKQNMGIRKMRSTYAKAYREMALNIVEGRSLTSGLTN